MNRHFARALTTLTAWILTLPVLLCARAAYSGSNLAPGPQAVFLAAFALILLGFLWGGKWLWLVLLVEWCFFPIGWSGLQMYHLVPQTSAKTTRTETIKWDIDPVDVYCNGTLLGQTPLDVDVESVVRGAAPADEPASETREIRGWTCRSFDASEALFDGIPRDAQGKYWWSFDCDGHAGLFCTKKDVFVAPETPKYAGHVLFFSIYAHADALVHGLQHAVYQPDAAWVRHAAAHLTPLFAYLDDAAYRNPRIKPALDQAVCEAFDIRESMSEAEVNQCWGAILDRVEAKRAFRIPSPEWYAINLLGDRLVPCLERSYVEERGRTNPRSRFHHGIRPAYLSPAGFSVRFLPVFYAVGRLRPPALHDRIIYDAGVVGQPFEVLMYAYLDRVHNRVQVVPYASAYSQLPGFENPQNSWEFASQFPTIIPYQGKEHTHASARLLMRSVPSTQIEMILSEADGGRRMPPFERLQYLAILRAPNLTREFEAAADGLLSVPKAGAKASQPPLGPGKSAEGLEASPPQDDSVRKARYMEAEHQRMLAMSAMRRADRLLNTVAAYPNPGLDKPLLACLERVRTGMLLPSETHALLKALIMCGTPAVYDTLGRWWDENPTVFVAEETLDESSPRALIIDAITQLPRMAEPLAGWAPRLATLDDPDLMARAVNALERIHTPEAWAVLEQWAASAPPKVADAAKRAIETERTERDKIAALIAGSLPPDDLVSP